jgi:Carbonic anhydrases/acetyltransferases, isoleucine patch superfamily
MTIHNGYRTRLLCYFNNRFAGNNKICPRPDKPIWETKKKYLKGSNIIKYELADCKNCIFDFRGKDNVVEIDDLSMLRKCQINIVGDGNHISIGKQCGIHNVTFTVEGSNDSIIIGDYCHFFCSDERGIVAAGHGSSIYIGEDSLFAPGIIIRSQDAHSLVDLSNNKKINSSLDIRIGKHVWMATRSIVLKGAEIGDGGVLGSGALVSNKRIAGNCLVIGNPAKIVKKNITWNMKW